METFTTLNNIRADLVVARVYIDRYRRLHHFSRFAHAQGCRQVQPFVGLDEILRHNAVRDAGTSIVSDTYHTASYVWLKDDSKAAQVAANISKEQNPYVQSVYFRSPLPGGC